MAHLPPSPQLDDVFRPVYSARDKSLPRTMRAAVAAKRLRDYLTVPSWSALEEAAEAIVAAVHDDGGRLVHAISQLNALLQARTTFLVSRSEALATAIDALAKEPQSQVYQRQLLKSARAVRDQLRRLPVERVDGSVVCQECRRPYRDHPEVIPTLHVGCGGTMLKT